MSALASASGLTVDEHGIWISGQRRELSYPETAHGECFQLEDRSYWFQHRNRCIVATVRRFPPGGVILDVGGGNGFVARGLQDVGFATELLEPRYEGAFNAKVHRRLPHVICSDLEDARIRPGTLCAVGCFDVIEHIADEGRFMETLRRLIRPEGLLYATVPAGACLWSQADVAAGHFRRYDRTQVARLMATHGFELLRFSYLFAPLAVPLWLLRALPWKLGLGHGSVLSAATEHGVSDSSWVAALSALLSREHAVVARGGVVPLGTSCLFVARRR